MPRNIQRSYSAFEIDGQRYERLIEEAHKTERGAIVVLVTWQSWCADCGTEFLFKSPVRPAPPKPVRRCKGCISPTGHHKRVKALVPRRLTPTGVIADHPMNDPMIMRRHAIGSLGSSPSRVAIREQIDSTPQPALRDAPSRPDVFTDR